MTLALYGLFKMGQLAESLNILISEMKREDQRLQADLDRLTEIAGKLVEQTDRLNQMIEQELN